MIGREPKRKAIVRQQARKQFNRPIRADHKARTVWMVDILCIVL